jgi:hypothetical protein
LDRNPGVVHYPEPASIRRLVLILRGMGVLKVEPPPALTSVQRCVAEYRRYLVDQRGLSERSLPNYISFVEQFLAERFGENEPRFAELCASDVTIFVGEQARKVSPVRKKLLVTALRSFLRYLLHQGHTTVGLAGCVPAVACWSLSEICANSWLPSFSTTMTGRKHRPPALPSLLPPNAPPQPSSRPVPNRPPTGRRSTAFRRSSAIWQQSSKQNSARRQKHRRLRCAHAANRDSAARIGFARCHSSTLIPHL